jgi:hypothetical protein
MSFLSQHCYLYEYFEIKKLCTYTCTLGSYTTRYCKGGLEVGIYARIVFYSVTVQNKGESRGKLISQSPIWL